MNLNRVAPDAGATYAWVGRFLHPDLGFLCGWVVLVTTVLFTVSATFPAAIATLELFAPAHAESQGPITAVAAAWIVAIAIVAARGVELSGTLQAGFTAIEIGVLALLVAAALPEYGPQIAELLANTPLHPEAATFAQFSAGAVVAVFFFWGWDVALNASEETGDGARTPGLAAVLAMLVVALAFVLFAFVALSVLGPAGIEAAGPNVIFAIADRIVPKPWSYLAVMAVMLSSVGSLQVSLLQFARTMYSAARVGDVHPRWGRVHERWQTPVAATWLNAGLGLALLAGSLAMPGIGAVLKASVNAIGLEIAFYYGLAAFACAWHFRHAAMRSMTLFVFAFAWPFASAVALWVVAAGAAGAMDEITLVLGIGGILVGVLPMIAARHRRIAAVGSPPY